MFLVTLSIYNKTKSTDSSTENIVLCIRDQLLTGAKTKGYFIEIIFNDKLYFELDEFVISGIKKIHVNYEKNIWCGLRNNWSLLL